MYKFKVGDKVAVITNTTPEGEIGVIKHLGQGHRPEFGFKVEIKREVLGWKYKVYINCKYEDLVLLP